MRCRNRCWYSGSKTDEFSSNRWYLGSFEQPYEYTGKCFKTKADQIYGGIKHIEVINPHKESEEISKGEENENILVDYQNILPDYDDLKGNFRDQ